MYYETEINVVNTRHSQKQKKTSKMIIFYYCVNQFVWQIIRKILRRHSVITNKYSQ